MSPAQVRKLLALQVNVLFSSQSLLYVLTSLSPCLSTTLSSTPSIPSSPSSFPLYPHLHPPISRLFLSMPSHSPTFFLMYALCPLIPPPPPLPCLPHFPLRPVQTPPLPLPCQALRVQDPPIGLPDPATGGLAQPLSQLATSVTETNLQMKPLPPRVTPLLFNYR